jgi:high-affinity iron transporter
MLAALLITLREGLEAALIVGIVMGYLKKTGYLSQRRYAWLGVLAALGGSAALAFLLQRLGVELEGQLEQIFEGTTMFLAVIVLTWMIFWMRYQARFLKSGLEREVRQATLSGQQWGLFGLTFFAVFREGVETALFLSATAFANDANSTLIGALFGLAISAALGWAMYASAVRLNVRRFFDITSVLLILFAAGLLAHGVHEFQEAGLLPILTGEVWNISHILPEDGFVGALLKSLLGYNSNPSLLEVIAYIGYYVVILTAIRWWTGRLAARPVAAST